LHKLLIAGVFLAVSPVLLAQQAMTNDSVIKMTKMGFSQDVIVTTINRSQEAFDTSADGLVALKSAGVGAQVISAMVAKTSVIAPAPPVQTPVAPAAPTTQSVTPTPVSVQTFPPRQAGRTTSKPISPYALLDGTPIKLRLGRTISSADEKVGNEVDFDTLEEITINGVVIIPKGSIATGTITEADHKKNMGRAGKMDVNIDSVRMADGEKAALRATAGGKAGGHTAAMTGAIVATSIVFFPAAPLFLFMHGKDLVIPKGTEITAYINGDTALTMARFAPSGPLNSPTPTVDAAAQLSVDSNVANCDIEVDGAFAGNTPSQLPLSAGIHVITISQKGYVPWSKKVLITSSGLHLRAELVAAGAPGVEKTAEFKAAQ
jgi:hypothetical protein